MTWADRVDALLEAGETVHERIDYGETTVVVTDRRVLAFTPAIDGANYRAIDRPNVDGVATATVAPTQHLLRAIRLVVAGVIALGAGLVFDFGAMIGGIDDPSVGGTGIGSALAMVETMIALLDALDDALLLGGALAILLAVAFGAAYWAERNRFLTIAVAGEDDVRLPVPDDRTREQIDRAVRGPAARATS